MGKSEDEGWGREDGKSEDGVYRERDSWEDGCRGRMGVGGGRWGRWDYS